MDLTNLDTSNVVDMSDMFSECANLTSLNIADWDTSKVIGMSCMFYGCCKLQSLDLSGWNTSNVKYMYNAFFGREADEDGLAYWADMLNNGTATREDVFAGFTGSAEFANLCAGYGINP